MITFLVYCCGPILTCAAVHKEKEKYSPECLSIEYGVDVSFPMHHARVSNNYPWLPHNQDPTLPVPPEYQGMPLQPLGNRQALVDRHIHGCKKRYDTVRNQGNCERSERARVAMNLRQPQSMRNYTQTGFTKIRAPEYVFSLLKEFWKRNKDRARRELWQEGNIYTNHWEAPSLMVSVESQNLEGGGQELKQHIWDAARETIQEWTGQRVVECSLYGIRVYTEGAILATHVDRLPLVSSVIINVDQDVDEPWPLEIIGHDGKAFNVTMEPGDLVLYESHSVLHGRPFPLKGRFMANVFIHFEPIGPLGGPIEFDGKLPPYILPGSVEASLWRKANPNGHVLLSGETFVQGSTDAHEFAANGNIQALRDLLSKNSTFFANARDVRGWTPLHHAVKRGDSAIARLLLEQGANPNARDGASGDGGSPLYYVYNLLKGKKQIAFHELKSLLEGYNGSIFERTFVASSADVQSEL